jgi:hypothetical protein
VTGGEELSAEATRLISNGEHAGIVLRALGSVGVGLHCPPSLADMLKRERRPKDIDLVSRKQDRRTLRSFFESEGYQTDRNMLVAMEGTRYLFRHPERAIDVDVWVDILDLCHKLDVTHRLGAGPTLPIEDLLLTKLQIVELTENDMQDLACMFSIHDLGRDSDDPETIDVPYLTGILGDDWGFWRTVTDNLQKLVNHMEFAGRSRAERLLADLQMSPKSIRWKVRARVGERMQWWQDVDIPRDTY